VLIALAFSAAYTVPAAQVGLPIPVLLVSVAYHLKYRPSRFKFRGCHLHNYFAACS
jgi:hypothetical protein